MAPNSGSGDEWTEQLDPETLRSVLNFPDPELDPTRAKDRKTVKVRIASSAPATTVAGRPPDAAVARAITALAARVDEMAAAQAAIASVVREMLDARPLDEPAPASADSSVERLALAVEHLAQIVGMVDDEGDPTPTRDRAYAADGQGDLATIGARFDDALRALEVGRTRAAAAIAALGMSPEPDDTAD